MMSLSREDDAPQVPEDVSALLRCGSLNVRDDRRTPNLKMVQGHHNACP